MPKKASPKTAVAVRDDQRYVRDLIARILDECPVRGSASPEERRAQQIMADAFAELGMPSREEPFRFNENLYANLALHFGLGTLGTVISPVAPFLGFLLHGTAAGSYWAESTRRGYFLRRLFPFKPSQNLLTTLPAKGEPELRVVFLAHADTAFTGLLFDPRVVERFSGDLPPRLQFLKRSLAVATQTQVILAGIDLLRMAFGPLTWPLRPLELLLTIPGFLTFVLNMEIVLRHELVPGANDDLSGVAALPVLASRLAATKPANVELVFVVCGCEEASLGGGDALARAKLGKWDQDRTVIIGLDGLTNGDLRYIEVEGEVVATPVPRWLKEVVDSTAQSERRFAGVTGFEVPVGGSDVAAFLAHGYDGVCLAAVDPAIGAPRHYHQRTDTLANLDMDRLMLSIDFAEKLARNVIAARLPR